MKDANETTVCEVWLQVDANGTYAVATDPAEFEADPALATRLVKMTLTVPTPKPVALVATIAGEPATGELTAL